MSAALGFVLALELVVTRVDVTSEAQRKQNLLEYVQGREDLSAAEKRTWDTALRRTFGGKAVVDGADEGVTVAKSVLAAAIFFGVKADVAVKAAYEAYHDSYRWVPPPIAINYQILRFQGRKPKQEARELAFNFPRYFNEDIAPDLVSWWDEMLVQGKIPEYERASVTEALRQTRTLMRPMLLERLWQATELAAKAAGGGAELARELERMKVELARDFRGVAASPQVSLAGPDFYASYTALARELGVAAKPRPVSAAPPPKRLEAPPTPPRPADGRKPPVEHAPPRSAPQQEVMAPRAPVNPSDSGSAAGLVPAPLPGEPLLRGFQGWLASLSGAVGSWLGTPYLWGGVDHRGIDCSGFVRAAFREGLRVDLPRNSRAQFGLGAGVESQGRLQPGDLLFFDTMDRGRVTHVGVYLGKGEFAHASSSRGVVRDQLAGKYYQRAYWGSRRILEP